MTHTVVVVPFAYVLLESALSARWMLAFFFAIPLLVPVTFFYSKLLDAMRGPSRSPSFAFGRSAAHRTMPVAVITLAYLIAYALLGFLGDM